jgi:competence protein ComEA
MAMQQKIDINEATKEELTRIPGISDKTAQMIIQFRESHGRIDDLEDLADTGQIRSEQLDNLRAWVTVGAELEEEEEFEEEEGW